MKTKGFLIDSNWLQYLSKGISNSVDIYIASFCDIS
jgi:hypothetical protein